VGNDGINRLDILGLKCDCGQMQAREVGSALGGTNTGGTTILLNPILWNGGNWKNVPETPGAPLNLPRTPDGIFEMQVIDSDCDEVRVVVNQTVQEEDQEDPFMKNIVMETRNLGNIKNSPTIFANLNFNARQSSILHPTIYRDPMGNRKLVRVQATAKGYKDGKLCCEKKGNL